MSTIFTQQDGRIMVKANGSGMTLLRKRFKIVNGLKTEYAQWIDKNDLSILWALNNLNMQMLFTEGDNENVFRGNKYVDHSTSEWVHYDGTVFIWIKNTTYDHRAYLVSAAGRVLAGSNVMPRDYLCLGESYNPYSDKPIDLLLYKNANRDLEWRGDSLEGEWKDNPAGEHYFEIHTWPCLITHLPVPQEIIDVTEHWWPA